MSSSSGNNPGGKLASNAVALYCRTLAMLVISLYTSRVVLQILGVDDYAVYSIIGNFVITFTVITSTLTLATQRFITVEIGRGDDQSIRRVFSTSLSLHIVLALTLILLCELFGNWYIKTQLQIPAERLTAARWVFHCSLLAMLFQFISIPFTSLIIAFERMKDFAWMSVVESLLKLVAVLVLPLLGQGADRLIWYAILLAAAALIVRIIYGAYCNRHFPQYRYQPCLDRQLVRQMSGFMGWNVFGFGADVVSKQFITLLINGFFPLAASAARGIALQVETNVCNFTRQIVIAFNPQITKSFANGEHIYSAQLVGRGAKFCYFMALIIAAPLIAETPFVLDLWLGHYPDHTVTMVRLSLINNLVIALTYTLDTMVLASGRIKWFQILSAVVLALTYPLTYLAYSLGLPVWTCYVASIVSVIGVILVKANIAQRTIRGCQLGYLRVLLRYCLPVTAVTACGIALAMAWCGNMLSLGPSLAAMAMTVAVCGAAILTLGLTADERAAMIKMMRKKP